MSNWKYILLFHNLPVAEPIGNDIIKIVPLNDQLVAEIRLRSETFCRFVDSFKDQFGRSSKPSLLFLNSVNKPDIESLVSFRNILAISSISLAWARVLSYGSQFEYFKYSDYFNFYPYSLTSDEKYLLAQTPSIRSLEEVGDFSGQPSPGIAKASSLRDFYDKSLFNELLSKWIELFIKKRSGKWELIALFRSLEMAFRASALPFGNQGTIHDYGASISLWVSAFEILIRPQYKAISYKDVLNMLGTIYFCSPHLQYKKYRIKTSKKILSLTLVQKTYLEMNYARNNFLHGNPVNSK
ncbi:MAG: hypothetical protein ABSA86_04435, partial [Oryzomonas sp.]